jgi:xanthine dehydrogenase molybdenum-binding subunit
MADYSVVGHRIPKLDAREKVTGRGMYAGDLYMEGMLYGKIVRCWEHAHATVKKIDFSDAKKVPGVVKCLGPKDVTQRQYNTTIMKLLVPAVFADVFGEIADLNIFNPRVKHQGDAVCGIIAKTEEAAERAAEKVKITYEPLPVVLTAAESKRKDAPQFTPLKPGNLAANFPEAFFPGNAYGQDTPDGQTAAEHMKEADLVLEETYYCPRQKQVQMENHTYIAKYDDRGRLTCWTSTQMPKPVQNLLAELFELPLTRVRVVQTPVGGAFGCRLGMIGEPHTCAMAMAVPGRPVKVEYLREEDWVASESRASGHMKVKAGFKKDGTPVALDVHYEVLKGGYYTHGSGPPFCTAAFVYGMYKWPAVATRADIWFNNMVPYGAYQGYGNPENTFAVEQIVDRACSKLGIDPIEWRKKWHKGIGDDTWLKGVKFASCGLDDCIEKARKAIQWDKKKKEYGKMKGTKRRGLGIGVMQHTSGAWPMLLEYTNLVMRLNEDCTVEMMVSVSDLGTGGHTAISQIASEVLGWPMDDVHLKCCDSDCNGFDIGAHASRTIYCVGRAVSQGAEKLKQELVERAAKNLQVQPCDLAWGEDKEIYCTWDPEKHINARQIAKESIYSFDDPTSGKTIGCPGQIVVTGDDFVKHCSPPFSASCAEVEVDTETGEVTVLSFYNAHDIGKAIHPPSVEGQLEGGSQKGFGYVLTEDIYYDKNGLCLNNDFTDYKMLGPSDMPQEMGAILVESAPDPLGPYGAKSCGESALMGPIGSVANAIYDAIGIQITEAPITPERVLAAIRKNGGVKK